jgi:hypothetical protein
MPAIEPSEAPAAHTDWVEWHRRYEEPDSVLSRRLVVVRSLLSSVLDDAPPGRLRLLSLCAGDGRDVLSVLEQHPRAEDVAATLVELDPRLAAAAKARAAASGLDGVTVVVDDAGRSSHVAVVRPLHVLLLCGVFGNVAASDVRRTIAALPDVLAGAGEVLWTRHRRPPDQTPEIRGWFEQAGLEERAFVEVPDSRASVGRHRLVAPPGDAPLPTRLFTFDGDGSGAHV